jgi:hypothetical protein
MKALSIISIVFSIVLLATSFVMMGGGETSSSCRELAVRLLLHLILGLFFLAFSIVATINSFKRKSK